MDRVNSEGYYDPTAYEALKSVAREEKTKAYMPLVYIASPYAGDTEWNTSRAQGYSIFAVSKGCIPLAPHLLYPQFMDDGDKTQRELGLRFALILLGKCDELWVFGDKTTDGMSREIAKAKRRGMPIRYWNSDKGPREIADFVGRGGATERMSVAACGDAKNAKSATTKEVSVYGG